MAQRRANNEGHISSGFAKRLKRGVILAGWACSVFASGETKDDVLRLLHEARLRASSIALRGTSASRITFRNNSVPSKTPDNPSSDRTLAVSEWAVLGDKYFTYVLGDYAVQPYTVYSDGKLRITVAGKSIWGHDPGNPAEVGSPIGDPGAPTNSNPEAPPNSRGAVAIGYRFYTFDGKSEWLEAVVRDNKLNWIRPGQGGKLKLSVSLPAGGTRLPIPPRTLELEIDPARGAMVDYMACFYGTRKQPDTWSVEAAQEVGELWIPTRVKSSYEAGSVSRETCDFKGLSSQVTSNFFKRVLHPWEAIEVRDPDGHVDHYRVDFEGNWMRVSPTAPSNRLLHTWLVVLTSIAVIAIVGILLSLLRRIHPSGYR